MRYGHRHINISLFAFALCRALKRLLPPSIRPLDNSYFTNLSSTNLSKYKTLLGFGAKYIPRPPDTPNNVFDSEVSAFVRRLEVHNFFKNMPSSDFHPNLRLPSSSLWAPPVDLRLRTITNEVEKALNDQLRPVNPKL